MESTSPSVATEATITVESDVKLPKNCKENRYYYKHREEILERKRQKKLEDPEYKEKYEERQRKKAEREALEKKRAEKRVLRKKVVEQILNPVLIASGGE
jgi:hypothetical protein